MVPVAANAPSWRALVLFLVLLFIVELLSPLEACPNHAGKAPKTTPPRFVRAELSRPTESTPAMIHAQAEAFSHLHRKSTVPPRNTQEPLVRQANKEDENDHQWMLAALGAAMACYGPCPTLPYGAVLVQRDSGELVMHSCNTVYLDATQHAEMNVLQLAAHWYPNRTLSWWQSLTMYTTAEPCAMCMAASRWTGIGEIVYGTSIDSQSLFGWSSIDVSAEEINNASTSLLTKTSLYGPFDTSLTDPYFAWQFNSSYPCPYGCQRPFGLNICLSSSK